MFRDIGTHDTSVVTITGVGIMGDSYADEYRADDNRGGAFADNTLNWMEQLALKRRLNFGPWGTWGEPRRSGYKYNWARSGATARSLITSGQHTGLAQQVANGEVSHVFLSIGGNDFSPRNGAYVKIYSGETSDAALQAKINGMVKNITTAVDTILTAERVPMVITNISDPGILPHNITRFPDPVQRQRITEAVNSVNAEIEALAKLRGISVADERAIYAETLAQIDENGFLEVGGEQIKLLAKGNEPHHGRLDDASGHPGTVASGLLANLLFIEPFNREYGLGITPFSNGEILENAGIISPQ